MLAALLLLATPTPAFDVECTYPSRSQKELVTAPDCARREGGLAFNPDRLRDFAFKRGLSQVNIGGQWYYVRQDGAMMRVMGYDNWIEPFQGGRARSELRGKIGYVDRRFRLVLTRIYDGAYPFEHGRAMVCFGCKLISDGEHGYFSGGSWACIDRRGRELGPRREVAMGQIGAGICD